MRYEQHKGVIYSSALHLVLLLLAIFGLPSFLQHNALPQPTVIAVEVLPISDVTNAKPSDLPLAKEEKPLPKEAEQKPTPPVKTNDTPPPPPEPKKEEKPKEKDVKKEEKKPDVKKEEKPKKAKEEDLEAVLKAVRDAANKSKEKDEKPKKDTEEAGTKVKADKTNYDASQPLSMTEIDAIRSQIAKCWSMPAGAKNAHELMVVLRVKLERDGSVISVELANESRAKYGSDNYYRAAADSAMRAVRQCSPLRNLSPDKYNTWRDMELNFDPKEMLF